MDQISFITGVEILDSSVATSSSASLYTYGGISILNTSNNSFLSLGGVIVEGNVNINSTTISTNTTTGALIINGGVGITGNIYGNIANFTNIQAIESATLPNLISTSASIGTLSLSTFNPSNITTNNLVVLSGTSIANAIFTNITTTNLALANNFNAQTITVSGTTESINTSTGALIIRGGVGIQKDLNINNNLKFNNTTGAFITIDSPGFLRVGADSQFRTHFLIVGDTFGSDPGRINYRYQDHIAFDNVNGVSTSIERMRITANGNLGIGTNSPSSKLHVIGNTIITENITIGNSLFTPNATINNLILTSLTTGSAYFNSTTISSHTGSGALIINGGVGIGGNLNIGGDTVIGGGLTVNGTVTSVNSTNVNISDNLIVLNSGPSSTADSGILIHRYQIDNNSGTGDVVSDTSAFNGTVQTGTSTSVVVLPSGASAIDSFYNNYWIKISSGTANNNVRQIISYVGATRTATLSSNLTSTPTANTDTFSLYGNVFMSNYFKESVNEYTFGFTNDASNNTITDTNYANLRIGNLNSTLISTNNLIVTNATISNFTLPTNTTFSNLVSTNNTLANLVGTNLNFTNATITNFSLPPNVTFSNLVSTNNTLANLVGTNLNFTNATITNFSLPPNVTFSNLVSTNNTLPNLTNTNLTSTNMLNTNLTSTNILVTNLTASILTITNLNLTNFTTENSRVTSQTIGNILASNINTTNITSNNAFFTNITTTNLISTTSASIAGINLQYYTGTPTGSWINLPIGSGAATGIGHDGPGGSPWIAYAGSPGLWFSNSIVGDICYRNVSGNLQFGNSTGISTMQINNNIVTINSTIDNVNNSTSSLVINGGVLVKKSTNIQSTTISTNTSTGALIVSGGGGFNGDIYAKNVYSNGVLLGGGGGGSVWGSNYSYEYIADITGLTGTTYQLRMSLTTGNLQAGTYHIHTGFSVDTGTVTNQNSQIQCLLDATALSTGTLIHETVFRPNNTNQITPIYEIITTTFGSGIHTLSMIYRNQSNGSATRISNSKLELYRIF